MPINIRQASIVKGVEKLQSELRIPVLQKAASRLHGRHSWLIPVEGERAVIRWPMS
jgi:hypothetical protein